MTKQTVKFTKEKETKNTVKFTEVPEDGKPPIIGTLYLQKWFAGAQLGVTVTVELEDEV